MEGKRLAGISRSLFYKRVKIISSIAAINMDKWACFNTKTEQAAADVPKVQKPCYHKHNSEVMELDKVSTVWEPDFWTPALLYNFGEDSYIIHVIIMVLPCYDVYLQ